VLSVVQIPQYPISVSGLDKLGKDSAVCCGMGGQPQVRLKAFKVRERCLRHNIHPLLCESVGKVIHGLGQKHNSYGDKQRENNDYRDNNFDF